MSHPNYYSPKGGLPAQSELVTDRSMFTEAYAVIPRRTNTDIVTSALPFWTGMRMWVLARPLSGFAESFSHYVVELEPHGGSERPETDKGGQTVLFVVEGALSLRVGEQEFYMVEGGYAYIPAGADWQVINGGQNKTVFHWIRKAYVALEGLDRPEVFVVNERDIAPISMPDTDDKWATTRFVDPSDMRHDMHVNIVTFQSGGLIPFSETHVMEHGLYVLQGKIELRLQQQLVSRLNTLQNHIFYRVCIS